MYESLHSERLESEPIFGVVFIAQVIGGKIKYGARLETPIRRFKNDFEVWDYEWDRERGPFMLHVNPIYAEMFDYPETKEWVQNTVKPWAKQIKKEWIEKSIGFTKDQLETLESALETLDESDDTE